jgi:hypothetical protein
MAIRPDVARRNTKHGASIASDPLKKRAYGIWRGMVGRCTIPTHGGYRHYGAKGITVCDRWRNFSNFWEDMGPPPTLKHTLDRRESKGNYEPSNCRWATNREQALNTSRNVRYEFQGQMMMIAEIADITGVDYERLKTRLRKLHWPLDKAISTPVSEAYARRRRPA